MRRTSAANWRMRAEPCAGRGAREVAICRSSIGYPKNELCVAETHDGNGSIEPMKQLLCRMIFELYAIASSVTHRLVTQDHFHAVLRDVDTDLVLLA